MPRILREHGRFRIDGHRAAAGLIAVLKWQMAGKRAAWPSAIGLRSNPPPPQRMPGNALLVTWIGHSTVLIQTSGLNVLTDPFLSLRASPVQWAGPKRVRAAALDAASLPPIDVILLSHNHYDHMDLPGLAQIARHHRPIIVTPLGNARTIARAAKTFEIVELTWGESFAVGGAAFHLTPALHWSKRGFFDANKALWGAFTIVTPGGTVYFAADTGYGEGETFRAIRTQFGPPRLSLLPIGAYEPRWFMKPQHMNPDEAAQAHFDLGSHTSLAIHHGTVQLTDEAIDAPVLALRQALAERNIDASRFLVPDAGEPVSIP